MQGSGLVAGNGEVGLSLSPERGEADWLPVSCSLTHRSTTCPVIESRQHWLPSVHDSCSRCSIDGQGKTTRVQLSSMAKQGHRLDGKVHVARTTTNGCGFGSYLKKIYIGERISNLVVFSIGMR